MTEQSAKESVAQQSLQVIAAILLFGTCSSTLLVLNKVAIVYLPAPATVLLCQLMFTAAAVATASSMKLIEADAFEWRKVRAFAVVTGAFISTCYANMKVLQYANVETFIVFRSSTPLLTSILDWMLLGRELPSCQSWTSLLVILGGAVGYVFTDSNFHVNAYIWVAVWFVIFLFDQIYIKHVVETVPMTTWGRVLYSNSLPVLPLVLAGSVTGELKTMQQMDWSVPSVTALLASCVVGCCMSFASFWLRKLLSATSFTVVGIICKIFTVIINCLIWTRHATPAGLACLGLSMAAGSMYRQAPKRAQAPSPTEEQPLISDPERQESTSGPAAFRLSQRGQPSGRRPSAGA